jgi:hypothetical protein
MVELGKFELPTYEVFVFSPFSLVTALLSWACSGTRNAICNVLAVHFELTSPVRRLPGPIGKNLIVNAIV